MALRQYMIVFCLVMFIVNLGNSSRMENAIYRRINALETKLENESKLRRSESEELFRMFSELAEYRATDLLADHHKLKSYFTKGVAVEKQQNDKLRSELKGILKQLKADYNVFESRIKEEISKLTNDVSDKLTLLVSEERFNNLSDFVTTSKSELRNEVKQSMISLTSDVEISNQKLYNDFQTLSQTAMKNTERCNNVSDSLAMITNERLNNLRAFVAERQLELRNETKQSLILLKSDVETSIQKLANDLQNVEHCNNVSDSLAIVTNERMNNLMAFVTTTQSELRNETRQSMFSLKSDVERSIQKLSNDFNTANQTAVENMERCNNAIDSLTIVTNERLNNLTALVTTSHSELRNETRQSINSLKCNVETSIQKISNDLQTVNQTAMEYIERCNNVKDSFTIETNERLINLSADHHNLKTYITQGVAVDKHHNAKLRSELKSISKQLEADYTMFKSRIKEEIRNFTNDVSDELLVSEERFNNFSNFVTTTKSELRNETRQYQITLKSDVETSIQRLSNEIQTVNQTAMENVERCNNVSDSFIILTNERLNNLRAFETTKHSELRNETIQYMISLKSDVETSIKKLSNDLKTVNLTAMENIERWINVSDSLTILTNERLNNLTAFVTTTRSELRNEARKSLISLKSDVETPLNKLYNDLQTVNQTTMENVERCNNVSDSFAIVATEKLKNLTAFVTITHAELRTESRHSIISLKSYVETSIQKLSNDLQTVNQTTRENVERWNNVSDYLKIFTNERLNNLTAFVNMAHSELRNETKQTLISLKSDVEAYNYKISKDVYTVNLTAVKSVERCNNVFDSLTTVTNERLNNVSDFVTTRQTELQNEARQVVVLLKSVEMSILKLSIDFRTLNQTALKNVESCKNVSDSTAKLINERLNTLSAFVSTKQSELQNETRQSLFSLKSDVEMSIKKISNDLHTVNQTALQHVECCNNVSDQTLTNNTVYIGSCKYAPKSNGIYNMYYAKSATPLRVYCDQTTDGGGWVVIQRRKDGSVNFERTWADYKTGFGDIAEEFWIGNDNLHALTSSGLNELRIDMRDFDGNKAYAKYSHFAVHPESELYKLEVSGYSGDASDSLIYHNGSAFSTKDRDNDNASYHCSESWRGAWWYNSCLHSNLNGYYSHGAKAPGDVGMFWYYWKTRYDSLKTVEIKIR